MITERDVEDVDLLRRWRQGWQVAGDGSSRLLVATGRSPVTAELGLAAAGAEMNDRGFIKVDDHLRTTAAHAWAAARVGLTETDARARHRIRVATLDAAAIPRAKTLHETVGTWKAVVDAETDQILGASLLGYEAGEVISAVQMAMLGGLRYQQVRDAVVTHPTMGEGLNLLFDALGDEA